MLGLANKDKNKVKASKKERKEKSGRIEEIETLLDGRREVLGLGESVLIRQENKVVVGSEAQRRARVLIWAHLLRWEFDERELKDGQLHCLVV